MLELSTYQLQGKAREEFMGDVEKRHFTRLFVEVMGGVQEKFYGKICSYKFEAFEGPRV